MFRFIFPSLNLNIEKWKWNEEYRTYVSNMGHFKNENKQNIPVRIENSGYVMIKTANGNIRAHRLVMKTWVPVPNSDNLTVDHLNHNKRDNSVKNLEWVTRKENLERANKDFIYVPVVIADEPVQELKFACRCSKKWKYFTSIEDVRHFLIENCKFDKSVPVEQIEASINKAVKRGRQYCGKTWKIV